MTDDHLRRWLIDDPIVPNATLVVVATAFTITLTFCLCHHVRPSLPDHPSAIVSAALASLHLSVAHTVPSATQQQSLSVSAPADEQKDRKSTRSKERRRRGKDPFRELLKGGKKPKALLKALKVTDHDHSPPSADTLSNSSVLQIDTASSTSRSQSPDPAGDLFDMDRLAPRLGAESDDGSVRSITPNGNASSTTSAVASPVDAFDHAFSDPECQTDGVCAQAAVSHDSIAAADTEANSSSASTIIPHAAEETHSSPSTSTACADVDVSTPQSHDSQAAYTSGSCTKLVRARTKLRLSRMDPSVKSALLSSTPPPLPDSVASPPNPINMIVPCPSLFITPPTSHSIDGAGPSTPTNSRGSTPPPRPLSTPEDPSQREPRTQPLDESAVSMQLASMRNALEAARLREEQLRAEAEQATIERDEIRWGWNEDAGAWRRREAELRAQIGHLMQQLQAYAAVASFQAQQASSAFSSPTSPHLHSSPRMQQHPIASFPPPPPIQPQNSASPPAHVQALLASAPMLTSHPSGFSAPSGGLYPGASFGMSPLLWSGLGLCVPNRDARHGGRWTPDSSGSGSSSRGRRRRRRSENAKSASDESSLGDCDGMEDGSGDEDTWDEEEDIFRNDVLADAILKRPESIRELGNVGKRSGRRLPMHGGAVEERMDALKDPVSNWLPTGAR